MHKIEIGEPCSILSFVYLYITYIHAVTYMVHIDVALHMHICVYKIETYGGLPYFCTKTKLPLKDSERIIVLLYPA